MVWCIGIQWYVQCHATISGIYPRKYYVWVTVYSHGSRPKDLGILPGSDNIFVNMHFSVSRLEQSLFSIYSNIYMNSNFLNDGEE